MARLSHMGSRETARVAEPEETDQLTPVAESEEAGQVGAWRFRLVVLKHHRLVYRVANALLRDRHEAEDATQEAFLRYWQRGNGVRHEREWLLTVVRNGCLQRLRRARHVVCDPEPSAELHESRDPEWHARHDDAAARLRERIGALPEPQRSLVILFDLHDLDGAACARILGLNVNQVKVYLHRARRRLRRELEESS